MKYPVFLCDFDGTLVRKDGTISNRNRTAIQKYCEKGGVFVLCTGRMVTSILPRFHELGLTGLIAAYQGATIINAQTGELLKDDAFTRDQALRATRFLEAKNEHVQIYTVEEMYSNRRDEFLEIYEKIVGVRATILNGALTEHIQNKDMRIVKVLAMVSPEERFALCDRAREALGEEFFITCSSQWLVEIMPKGQDKGSAAEFLSRYYDVPLERIAAIGDQDNDLPMIERVGGKFTLENGEESLKQIARVMPSFEEDGVACALEIAMEE